MSRQALSGTAVCSQCRAACRRRNRPANTRSQIRAASSVQARQDSCAAPESGQGFCDTLCRGSRCRHPRTQSGRGISDTSRCGGTRPESQSRGRTPSGGSRCGARNRACRNIRSRPDKASARPRLCRDGSSTRVRRGFAARCTRSTALRSFPSRIQDPDRRRTERVRHCLFFRTLDGSLAEAPRRS